MQIYCEDWQEGLTYFFDPRIQAQMRRMKISVERMDWKTKTVHLKFDDDEMFLAALEGLQAIQDESLTRFVQR